METAPRAAAAQQTDGATLAPTALGWRAIGPTPTTPAFPNNWGLTSGRINAVAISPTNPNLVLVGASTGGIWRSTDGGQNFTPVSDAQVDLSVGSIAFSRSDPAIVYAGMGDLYNSYLGTGVLRSTDAGQTWTRVNNATLPSPATTAKLEVSPVNPNKVYLVQYLRYDPAVVGQTTPSGIFVSNDGGVSWTRTFTGLVRDLVIHPTNPQIIYIGVRRADAPAGQPGLYKSIDGGNTWAITYASPLGAYTNSTRIDMRVAVTPAAPDTVYIFTGNTISPATSNLRVEVSNDGGQTWTNRSVVGIDPGQFGYNAYIFVDPTNPNILYAGTRDVHKSIDGGLSWTSLTRNFVYNGSSFPYNPFNSRSHPDQHAFAFAPNDANTIYIGNDGGLSKSVNGGASFASLNATLALSQFIGIAMHPTDPTRTVGGTQDNGTQFRAASGNGWQEFAEGDGGHPVISATDPSVVFSTYVYAAIRWWRFNPDGSRTELSSRRTSPNSFQETGTSRINFYPPFTNNGVDSTLYFGTWRLFVSTTYADPNLPINSSTWTAPGLTTDLTKGGTDVLNAIGVERRAGAQVIYTGSEQGRAMVTANGGQTWADVTAGLPDRTISSIRVDPQNAAVAYLSVSGYASGHVFKTINQGQTWTDISGNLPNIPVSDTLIDPLTPTTLYAATDVGVFRSLVGGTTWESFNLGLPPTVVTNFATNASGRIQIATYGRGAYELTNDVPEPVVPAVQFSAASVDVEESAGSVSLTVIRTGDATNAASVVYQTLDSPAQVRCDDQLNNQGAAYARCDYATTVDTINFAAGETQRTVTIPIIDDAHLESLETFQVALTNPSAGLALSTPSNVTVTIISADSPTAANPIFNTSFFVRQHYLDFLSREPEAGEPWSNVLNNCSDVNNNPNCDRLTVSAAFFGSPEFQLKGYFVYRFYKLAFNRLPAYAEIIPDMRQVTGTTPAEVYAKKAAFSNAFTQRTEFVTNYGGLTNTAYVTTLLGRYNLTSITTPDPQTPDGNVKVTLTSAQLINALTAGTLTRAQVLRAVADSDQAFNAEFNQAFVAMQYYGYLRRTPEPSGYQAWLNYLNTHPGDSRTMVNGFMNSQEYRLRFGQSQ